MQDNLNKYFEYRKRINYEGSIHQSFCRLLWCYHCPLEYDGVIDIHSRPFDSDGKLYDLEYSFLSALLEKKRVYIVLIELFCVFAQKHGDIHFVLAGGFNENDSYYQCCVDLGKDFAEFCGVRYQEFAELC